MHRFLSDLFCNEGQQSDLTCALDSDGQLTLMLCAGAGHTAGQDLAALGNISAKLSSILEVDLFHFINTERTDLSTLAGTHIATLSALRTLGALGTFGTLGSLGIH